MSERIVDHAEPVQVDDGQPVPRRRLSADLLGDQGRLRREPRQAGGAVHRGRIVEPPLRIEPAFGLGQQRARRFRRLGGAAPRQVEQEQHERDQQAAAQAAHDECARQRERGQRGRCPQRKLHLVAGQGDGLHRQRLAEGLALFHRRHAIRGRAYRAVGEHRLVEGHDEAVQRDEGLRAPPGFVHRQPPPARHRLQQAFVGDRRRWRRRGRRVEPRFDPAELACIAHAAHHAERGERADHVGDMAIEQRFRHLGTRGHQRRRQLPQRAAAELHAAQERRRCARRLGFHHPASHRIAVRAGGQPEHAAQRQRSGHRQHAEETLAQGILARDRQRQAHRDQLRRRGQRNLVDRHAFARVGQLDQQAQRRHARHRRHRDAQPAHEAPAHVLPTLQRLRQQGHPHPRGQHAVVGIAADQGRAGAGKPSHPVQQGVQRGGDLAQRLQQREQQGDRHDGHQEPGGMLAVALAQQQGQREQGDGQRRDGAHGRIVHAHPAHQAAGHVPAHQGQHRERQHEGDQFGTGVQGLSRPQRRRIHQQEDRQRRERKRPADIGRRGMGLQCAQDRLHGEQQQRRRRHAHHEFGPVPPPQAGPGDDRRGRQHQARAQAVELPQMQHEQQRQ